MCGICGTLGFTDQDLIQRMLSLLTHRGPDDEGTHIENGAVGLGIRRLSIIDLETGHQPIHNERETVWVVYNGEIYNFRELRKDLENKGHRFYTRTDTEVIVHLYEEYGDDCVDHLRGMFAFALWDKEKNRALLARDRVGIKPLYYTLHNGNLVFASEMKAILEYGPVTSEVDIRALEHYMTFLYTPAETSILKGIFKLPPASVLVFQNGEVKTKKYWDIEFTEGAGEQRPLAPEHYEERLYALLEESVKIRMESDVPLGVFLSGGIDSSAIVGMMAGFMDRPVKTFSIGYGEKDASYNELAYARLISERFGTEHAEYIIEPVITGMLPKIAWFMDEPLADSSSVPNYMVSHIARDKMIVALTGLGGDECFAGYPRYLGGYLAEFYQKIPIGMRRLAASAARILPESVISGDAAGRVKRFFRGGVMPLMEGYIEWITFLSREQRGKLFTPDALKELGSNDARAECRGLFDKANTKKFMNKVFYADTKSYLPGDLLFISDRMSMANSIELRQPFCDHKLLEFSAGIPFGTKIKGLRLKSLFKKSVAGLLPPETLRRRKSGFMLPVGRWLKEELKETVDDLLSEASVKRRGYFNYGYIKCMLERHRSGKNNFSDQIWSLLVLETWFRVYIDKTIKVR